jgi:hypothetical protein
VLLQVNFREDVDVRELESDHRLEREERGGDEARGVGGKGRVDEVDGGEAEVEGARGAGEEAGQALVHGLELRLAGEIDEDVRACGMRAAAKGEGGGGVGQSQSGGQSATTHFSRPSGNFL